jgi:hypothetical protein
MLSSKSAYDRERWQIEHAGELLRHRALSQVVAEHALVMIDGLHAGVFRAPAMRKLVNVEQRWKELAQLNNGSSSSSCVESISNLLVQHLEEQVALPWQPSDFLTISSACVAEHHRGNGNVAHQRLTPMSERHFESYTRLLAQLARLEPCTEAWYASAAHTINAAVGLGTHLDWVNSIVMTKRK